MKIVLSERSQFPPVRPGGFTSLTPEDAEVVLRGDVSDETVLFIQKGKDTVIVPLHLVRLATSLLETYDRIRHQRPNGL